MTDRDMFKNPQEAKEAFAEAQKNYFMFPRGSVEKQQALDKMEQVVEFMIDHYKEKTIEFVRDIKRRYFV